MGKPPALPFFYPSFLGGDSPLTTKVTAILTISWRPNNFKIAGDSPNQNLARDDTNHHFKIINKIKINYYTNFEKLSPCFSAVIQIFAEAEQFFSGKQKYCLRKYLSAIQKCRLCINKIKINYYTHFEKLSPCGAWRGCSLKGKRHTFFTSSKTTGFKAIKIIFYFLVH